MDESIIPGLLEELLEGFGVRIRYQAIKQDQNLAYVAGGLCILKGEYVLIVNSSASTRERVIILAAGLKHFDLDNVYIRPVVSYWTRCPNRDNSTYHQLDQRSKHAKTGMPKMQRRAE